MRKKLEFKPDSTGASLLQRMYLTPQQRKTGLRWFLYCLLCLGALILQDVIFSRIRLLGATTDLVPAVLLLICVIQGAETGGTFALAAAVIYYLSGSAPGTYVILLIPVIGVLVSLFRRGYLRRGFSAAMLCAGVGILCYEMLVFALGLLTGQTILNRWSVFALTGAICLGVLPVLYPAVLAISRIGGESWRE